MHTVVLNIVIINQTFNSYYLEMVTPKNIIIQDLELADKEIKRLREENNKLKLHIEAKDKAYTALLKDYEEIKKDRKKILDEIEAEIERFKAIRQKI